MKRLEIEKIEENTPSVILKQDEDVSLNISFGGNLDLYFVLNGSDKQSEFVITKANYNVYKAFLNLYNNVINCKFYEENEFMSDYERYLREKHKELLMLCSNYNLLVKDGVITWLSDDFSEEVGPSFQIIKKDDSFIIKFNRGNEEKQDLWLLKHMISVRIRNSGSMYNPFNYLFMHLFRELKELDLEDRQIHIEEYVYEEKLKRMRSN